MSKIDDPDPAYQDTYRLLPELAKVRAALFSLSHRHRLAFALCCCERLYPAYHTLTTLRNLPDQLRPILDRLWAHAFGHDMRESEIACDLATCFSITFEEGSEGFLHTAFAAIDATYVTLDACRQYSLDNCVRVAEISRNDVDEPIWKELAGQTEAGVGPDEHHQIEGIIRSHPAMTAEVEKEANQLRFLYECEEITRAKQIQLLGL